MKIVFATNNEHKLSEIRDILGDKVEVLSLNDIGCHVDIPETGETLEENALEKARYVFDHYGMSVFSDDTGLEVEALGGAPGVHTARYAGGEGHDAEANTRKLLREMADKDNRRARFRTAIALITTAPDNSPAEPPTHLFEGIVEGEITREKRGEKGFGYDPVFQPEGYDKTFAELGVEVKNQISHRARAVQKLVKYLSGLLLFYLFTFLPLNVNGQIGIWHNYMAYHDVQNICAAGENIFVQASNSLYTYNTTDQSITTYDKVNGLSDTYIAHIRWNPTVKRLLIVYQNQNIDLIEEGGGVTNLSDLYQKSMTDDKTVNNVYIYEQYAYLACGFGVVKVDMDRIEISESYNLGANISQVAISAGTIYAKQKSGTVVSADMTKNLIDPNNWSNTVVYEASIFDEDHTDYNQYIETVKTLNPGGPKYNYMNFLRFKNNKLYTCNGVLAGSFDPNKEGCIQVWDGSEWQIFQDDLGTITGHRYMDLAALAVDPLDPTHLYASGRVGLYEFKDGQFVKEYNYDNSELESNATLNHQSKDYTMVESMVYDTNGSLWFFNSASTNNSLFEITTDGEWINHSKSEFKNSAGRSFDNIVQATFDSRGILWACNDRFIEPALICYQPSTDAAVAYTTFVNQDGTKLENMYGVTCAVEDKSGNIWVGTDVGPLLIEKDNIGKNAADMVFTQVKVPRNDGTNFADYLLAGVHITCIMVDNDGQKWMGTNGNGIYVISSDNMTEVHHFTAENSQLLSNIVGSIAMNEQTGEVFIGTENGLCSYMSGIVGTIDEMQEDDVYAYPNPVTPDYNGLITITGLSNDASVKILTSNGRVVAEGKSNGRFFTWNGHDKNGERVASGIYMVATATSSGDKGVVCKIAIVN